MRVVESTLTRVVKPRAHRHLVLYLPSVQLYRSSAKFHTGWRSEFTLICPQLLCCPLLVLSLLVQSFPSPPCSSSQDDGRSPRVDHYCFIFAFSQPYGAISLSPCLWDNNTSHIFSFTCLRLVSNGCYCFVICFHVVICFNSDLPFSFPSCMEAQGWGEFSSTSSPTDILRDCRHCR